MKSTILKWSVGLITSLLVSFIMWILIGDHGVISTKLKTPDVQLLTFDLASRTIMIGDSVDVKVEFYNKGDEIATNCRCWVAPEKKSISGVKKYNIKPNESVQSKFTIPPYKKAGKYAITFALICDKGLVSRTDSIEVINCENESINVENVKSEYTIEKGTKFGLTALVFVNNCPFELKDVKIFVTIEAYNMITHQMNHQYSYKEKYFDLKKNERKNISIMCPKVLQPFFTNYRFHLGLFHPRVSPKGIDGRIRIIN